jgi:uncharacterized small protein (DUF1192 family)
MTTLAEGLAIYKNLSVSEIDERIAEIEQELFELQRELTAVKTLRAVCAITQGHTGDTAEWQSAVDMDRADKAEEKIQQGQGKNIALELEAYLLTRDEGATISELALQISAAESGVSTCLKNHPEKFAKVRRGGGATKGVWAHVSKVQTAFYLLQYPPAKARESA